MHGYLKTFSLVNQSSRVMRCKEETHGESLGLSLQDVLLQFIIVRDTCLLSEKTPSRRHLDRKTNSPEAFPIPR